MANEFVARNGIISKGGFTTPHKVVSSGYQITIDDYLIECSGSFTVTLPNAVGIEGKHYIIKNNGSLIISIATTLSQTIDGVTSVTLAAHSSIQLISTGANWINVLIGDSNTLDGLDSTSFALTTSLNGTQNYLTKYGDSGITQSNIYDNGTNVGIGTTTPVQQLDITGSFNLPHTTPTQNGIIYKSNIPFIHNFNYGLNSNNITTTGDNTFIGINAGNFTMGSTATATYHSSYNIGIGGLTLNKNTTGSNNTAIGMRALFNNTTGSSNTAIGTDALKNTTTGSSNTAIGMNALFSNTTGDSNFALGTSALFVNTIGYANIAIGAGALSSNTTGRYNSAIGANALQNNITGIYNSAFGSNSGSYLANGTTGRTTGNYGLYLGFNSKASADGTVNEIVIGYNAIGKGSNTAAYGNSSMVKHIFEAGSVGIGTSTPVQQLDITGSFNLPHTTLTQDGVIYKSNIPFIHNFNYGDNGTVTTDGYNTFLGVNAGNFTMGSDAYDTYCSSYNTGVGEGTLYNNTDGYQNSAIGANALYSNIFGYQNSAVGVEALYCNTEGGENSAIGAYALYSNTYGYRNSAIGVQALYSNTEGFNNSAIGVQALYSNTYGYSNCAIGVEALYNNTEGNGNSAIGGAALYNNTTGSYNSAIGTEALLKNTTGSDNSAIGAYALYSNTYGYQNSAIGVRALLNNTTGSNNSAIGANALQGNINGYNNSAIGANALQDNINGSHNSAIGLSALSSNTTGSNNSAIGMGALSGNTTGSNNSAIGVRAGYYLSNGTTGRETGNNGLYLGYNSKASANGTDNEIVIGYNAVGKGSNTAAYGNSSMVKHIFEAGNVGINTITPYAKLHTKGSVIVGNGPQNSVLSTNSLGIHENSGVDTALGFWQNGIASSLIGHKANDSILYLTNTTGGSILGYLPNSIALKSNGNVGIGIDPTEKLDVNGNVKANEHKYTTGTNVGSRYNATDQTIEFYFS